MSDPITTLKKYMVLKFMEKYQATSNTELQQEFIQNAINTAQAVNEIGNIGMFNFNKDQQNPSQQMNQQVPQFEMPQVKMPEVPNNSGAQTQNMDAEKYYQKVSQEQERIQKYHQAIMAINQTIMEIQQAFSGNMQKIQQDLNKIVQDMFRS